MGRIMNRKVVKHCACSERMQYPDKEKWNGEFIKPLVRLIKKYKNDISLKHVDFPYRWQSILKQ